MSDIQELFSRDPLSLTQENIDEIITHYRKCRAQFNLGNMKAGSAKPSAAAKKGEELTTKLKLNLELDL